MKLIEGQTFARKCDITGEGMNKGYCIGDGDFYVKHETNFLSHLATETDYSSSEEAYEDDYYYYTEWEDIDNHQFKVVNGKLEEIEP